LILIKDGGLAQMAYLAQFPDTPGEPPDPLRGAGEK
jgi:hypothetical protein